MIEKEINGFENKIGEENDAAIRRGEGRTRRAEEEPPGKPDKGSLSQSVKIAPKMCEISN
jgi:hypothetical protein